MAVNLRLPFPPSANRIWRVSRSHMHRSAAYMEWRRQAGLEVLTQPPQEKVAGKYNLTIIAHRPDKRRRDIDNLVKPLSDFAQWAGLTDGDHLAESIFAAWAPTGATGSGVEIRITEYRQ